LRRSFVARHGVVRPGLMMVSGRLTRIEPGCRVWLSLKNFGEVE
jgi:hypothetical protein